MTAPVKAQDQISEGEGGPWIEVRAAARIDLTGGTLDLWPIGLTVGFQPAITLNVAIDQYVYVKVRRRADLVGKGIVVSSRDYKTQGLIECGDFSLSRPEFHQKYGTQAASTEYAWLLAQHFELSEGIEIETRSDLPPGSGLGGSSTLGVALWKAFSELTGRKSEDVEKAVMHLQNVEATLLNRGPAGHQDFYPGFHGGLLSLEVTKGGVQCAQLFSKERAQFLESHLALIDSGKTRASTLTNWEVYKAFYDGEAATRQGLEGLAKVSFEALAALNNRDTQAFLNCLKEEGKLRRQLYPGIQPENISNLEQVILSRWGEGAVSGVKMCGAGGGGFFVCAFKESLGESKGSLREQLNKLVEAHHMKLRSFRVSVPTESV